jgi:lipoprotein-releasing system ATP-binding protein
LLATLDEPDAGEVWFDGARIDDQPAYARDELRNRDLGMIFQFYHLLPELTMLDNVLLPLMIAESSLTYWWNRAAHLARAEELLDLVGLSHRVHHLPRELSGGEMQRAAIARALIAGPRILLADEPTGNLDSGNGREVLRILGELNREHGLTLVMVTHDTTLAGTADRIVRLREGQVERA